MAKQLYFIAIELPDPIKSEIQEWRRTLSLQYHSKHALKTPPHITLQMPMRIEADFEKELINQFHKLDQRIRSGPVYLKNIGSFDKRTIFIDVETHGLILELHQQIQQLIKSLEFINDKIIAGHFHPHLTLMTRDLNKTQFELAFTALKRKEIQLEVFINKEHLYKHDGKFWRSLTSIGLLG